jgi:hypothetical protein
VAFLVLSIPARAAIQLSPVISSGLASPTFVGNAGDGSHRLFILEQPGIVRVLQPGTSTATVFLDVRAKIVSGGEQGLLGLAFHPQYSINGRFFLYYTRAGDGTLVIAEYKVSASDPMIADPAERVLLTIPHPTNTNHNGGMLAFGPDGYLYIGVGDGGSANDPPNNSQNIEVLLGKILRIDVDPPADAAVPYVSPPSNPFYGAIPGRDEIFALGMRNPWRFSFDRGTGQQWVGDVGQSAREEVDTPIRNGGNYGWRVYEGFLCTNNDPALCNPADYVFPIFDYTHSVGRCSITGGYVYRGSTGTLPPGTYVYADYCTGEIFAWDGSASALLLDTAQNISSFGEDEDGELYVVNLAGSVSKIVSRTTKGRNADFDGDGRTDLSVWRPATGGWYLKRSSDGIATAALWGNGTPPDDDIPVPGDYDGDGKTDIAVWRPRTGAWYIVRSSDGVVVSAQLGAGYAPYNDQPVPADYDGDGKTDLAVWRGSTGTWYILRSSDGFLATEQWGAGYDPYNDIPVEADYDGDGLADLAVWRPSTGTWYILRSTDRSMRIVQWGSGNSLSPDVPVPADFDGDGTVDIAVWRPGSGTWYVLRSSDGGVMAASYGAGSAPYDDIPVPGDYDGDGRADLAVWRPTSGVWYLLLSSSGTSVAVPWGAGDAPYFDRPIPPLIR